MDLRLRQLIRDYKSFPDIELENVIYGTLIRLGYVPNHWIKLLAFLGDEEIYNLPSEHKLSSIIESVYELRPRDSDPSQTIWKMREFFPFQEQDFFISPSELELNHRLLVFLVGCYLRETLDWLFNVSKKFSFSYISQWDWVPEWDGGLSWEDYNERLKNQTRDSVVDLLIWTPGRTVREIEEELSDMIPEEDPDPEVARGHPFCNTLRWLLELLSGRIAFERYCSEGCIPGVFGRNDRHKWCPYDRDRGKKVKILGPYTTLGRLSALEQEAFQGHDDHDPSTDIISACYAMWYHSHQPVENLHQKILSHLRGFVVNLILTQL